MISRESVIPEFVVLGVGQIYLGSFPMVSMELLSVGDKVSSLLSVSCDGGTGYREFQPEVQFDGGINHGIKSEDFLLPIGVLRVTANSDSGIHVGGKLRASKEERVFFHAVI